MNFWGVEMSRLIDADAFEVFAYTHTSDEFDDGVRFVLEKIDEAPTIDPVRHGFWIDCSNGWMCSECNRDYRCDHNFCPNCGARMDVHLILND